MPGRKYSAASGYRYGFNGKENDNEVKGEGNQIDYGERIYDPRIGRFLSVDPLTRKFPNLTPYQYAGNKPIWCIDLDGLEDLPYTEKNQYGEKQVWQAVHPIVVNNIRYHTQYETVTPSGQPVTQNKTNKEIYRMVVARMLAPGQFKIADNEYLDKQYMLAEERVKYYFSHHATATMSKGPHSDKLTAEIHNTVVNALLSDDATMSDAAVTMIDRRTSFLGKFNWAKTAVEFGAGALIASGFKFAMGRMSGALESLGVPKGFGIMADPSKFRVASGTLSEQLAMKEAMSGGGTGVRTEIIKGMTGDKRITAAMDISKYSYHKDVTDRFGNVVESVEIHYLKNNKTGATFDYKFK